jgi:hypothetical protein
MTEMIQISSIKQDAATQPRVKMDMSIVEEYAEEMKNKVRFPALDVFKVDEEYILVDGYHRVLAAQSAGLKKLPCEVHDGTMRDAILFASGVNDTHGVRRTNEDKRRAVKHLLNDPEWSQWSDNKIAEICKVSPMTVGKYREVTIKVYSDNRTPERTYTTKQGKTSTMKTENIGKKKLEPETEVTPGVIPEQITTPVIESAPIPLPPPRPPTPVPTTHKTIEQVRKEKAEQLDRAVNAMLDLMPSTRFRSIIDEKREQSPGEFKTSAEVITRALDFFAEKWKP